MKKARVALPDLFQGEMLGGYSPEDWENLSQSERLASRLTFIESRARTLADLPFDPDNGLPVNVHVESLRLANKAESALLALDADDSATAAWFAVEVGLGLERIKTVLALAKALELIVTAQKPRKKGGDTTALIKKESARKSEDEVVKLWKDLERQGKPERNRAGIIATRLGQKVNTVRRRIKKAGLR